MTSWEFWWGVVVIQTVKTGKTGERPYEAFFAVKKRKKARFLKNNCGGVCVGFSEKCDDEYIVCSSCGNSFCGSTGRSISKYDEWEVGRVAEKWFWGVCMTSEKCGRNCRIWEVLCLMRKWYEKDRRKLDLLRKRHHWMPWRNFDVFANIGKFFRRYID